MNAILTLVLFAQTLLSGGVTFSGGATVTSGAAITTPGPLAVCASNPRYFCDPSGNVVWLGGAHTWANIEDEGNIQAPGTGRFQFSNYVAWVKSQGYTWERLWLWGFSQDMCCTYFNPYNGPVWPWKRVGPGTANDGLLKTDFTQLDPAYFARLRSRIQSFGQAGIYVSVQMFQGSEWDGLTSDVDGNPFESGNNVNSINCSGDGPATLPLCTGVSTIEQAYIDKVVDTVHDLPNVLYEITNESPIGSASWEAQVLTWISDYENTTYGTHHPIGMNYGNSIADSNVYDTDADWVCPSTKVPPAATGQCPTTTGNGGATNSSSGNCKVVINDSDHSYYYTAMQSDGSTGQIAWAWENFTLGNGVAFMDPYLFPWSGRNACTGSQDGDSGMCTTLDTQWNQIRNGIADIAGYAKEIDLKRMTPQTGLFSSGYGLAYTSSPESYLMFTTGNATITTVAGTYTVQVFDTVTHAIVSTTTNVSVSTSYSFTAPGGDNYAVWLHQ